MVLQQTQNSHSEHIAKTMTKAECLAIKVAMVLACLAESAAHAIEDTAPQLTLLVENNFPHATRNPVTNAIEGIEVEIITSLMKSSGISFSMTMLPWNRAFRRTLAEPDTCLFPINHTEKREHLFQWVSPTQRGGWAIFKRADSEIRLGKIEDVAGYRLVAKMGVQAIGEIKAATGTSVMPAATDMAAAQLLHRGRADLLVSGFKDGRLANEQAGFPGLKVALFWKPAYFGLACNPGTDARLVEKLRAANLHRLVTEDY